MTKKIFALLLFLGFTTIAYTQSRPNVIVILTDDQGSIDMGAYGVKDLKTPNMDKIAARGVRFTQFYAGAPVCSPSRATMLTGKMPWRAGVPGNVPSTPGNAEKGLPSYETTMAEMLKNNGYKTAHIGKWHLGYVPALMPNAQGFDYSFGHMGGCIDNYSHFFYWRGPNSHDLHRNGQEVYHDGEFFPDLMVQEAEQFMERNKEHPFFIYFAMNTPHYPYQGSPDWLRYYRLQGVPYPRDLYNAFVSTLDERIGRLINKVEALGLSNNTIIIFQSDHGHSTEERAHYGGGNAGPYRGAKFSLFEGGIRIPAIISWPGHLPEGEVRHQMTYGADWMPTIAELCGIKSELDFDGKSLLPIINNQFRQPLHENLYWRMNSHWAIREGDWKLLYDPADTGKGRDYIKVSEEDRFYLVNLKEDIGENNNLASQHPEIVARLEKLQKNWEARIAAATAPQARKK